MGSFDYRNQFLPRERPGLLSGSAAWDARMRAVPRIDEQAAVEPLPDWMNIATQAALAGIPLSKVPLIARATAQGAKEIWESPIGGFLRAKWPGELGPDEEEREWEPLPIGGDQQSGEFLGPDAYGQNIRPPLVDSTFGDDSVGAARIAEIKSLDEAGFSSRSIQAARNLEDREYTAQELMKIFYPTSRGGNPKPSKFSAEELKWMGVPDYLRAMENAGQKISWADLNEYMENNRVQLGREVRQSDKASVENSGPENITWAEPANYFDEDKPAWSEQVSAEIPDYIDDMKHDIGLIKEHYNQGGGDRGVRNLSEKFNTFFFVLEDLMSREGWAFSDIQGLGWRTDQEIEEKATTLAEHMVAYNYEQEPFYRVKGRIPQDENVPDHEYEIIGNDSGMWRVRDNQGNFLQGYEGHGAAAGDRVYDTLENAKIAALEDALDSGLLTEFYEDDEHTVAGPGSSFERYNLYGLEGAEPDSYREVIFSYNRWGPTFGGNYPTSGYAGIPDITTSKYHPVDRGITLYSEPHFGARNAFLHMRMHDRYFPGDGRGNIVFMEPEDGGNFGPVVDITDEGGKYLREGSDGFQPVKVRIFDEIQSKWNTDGRDRGFSHPTKYVVFNAQTGKELGRYDTGDEMEEAHPNIIEDASLVSLARKRQANLEMQGEDVLDAPEWAPLATVDESTLIDYTPPLGATDRSRVAMHPLMERGETYMAGFKDFIRAAKEDGIGYIFIPGGAEQGDRYSFGKDSDRYQKMINFYDEMFPRMINKFLTKIGSDKLQNIGITNEKVEPLNKRKGWLLKITPALEAAIMEGLDLYSKVITPKNGLLGRREEGLLAYA